MSHFHPELPFAVVRANRSSRPFAVIRKADVRLDGEKLAELGDGRFVGQIAYIAGEKAPVSIVAKRSTRIISWSHVKLKTFSKTGLM